MFPFLFLFPFKLYAIPLYLKVWVVVCRLLHFSRIWETVTDDHWVLHSVSEGIKLDFVGTPKQTRLPCPVAMSEEMASVCDREVNQLLVKKTIVKISNSGKDDLSVRYL